MKKFLAYAAIGLGVVGYSVMTQADRDASGAIVDSGNVDAFAMRLGDCFDNTPALASETGGQVSMLPGVPCSEPHDNEVYAIFDVDYDAFPGDEPMAELAFEKKKLSDRTTGLSRNTSFNNFFSKGLDQSGIANSVE